METPQGYGTIYFLQGELTKRIKIGFSNDQLKHRIKQIQACSPDKLKLLLEIGDATYTQEKFLHRKFFSSRLHGEWFGPSKKLMKFISLAKKTKNGS